MDLYSDTYYIKRIQAGDVSCFACLLDRYSGPIHSLIYRITGNHEDAEELAQDCFLKVFKNIDSFRGDCKFSTWIYRIAYNTAISATRKHRQEFLSIDESAINNISEEEVANILGNPRQPDILEHLEKALKLLPPDERALILLFYWKDKSIDEIATISGISQSNTKVKLHRIRKKLFVILKEMTHE